MFFMIRFGFYFLFIFSILSIPVGKRPLFNLLHEATAPVVSQIYSITAESAPIVYDKIKNAFVNAQTTASTP